MSILTSIRWLAAGLQGRRAILLSPLMSPLRRVRWQRNAALLATLALLLYPHAELQAVSDPRAQSAFYIDAYGLADPSSHPQVHRASRIFEQLKRNAGTAVASSRLIIVDSTGKPWAVALADGNVVLSRGALDIIYDSAGTERGDHWLAFVLGHELAHLANRDLWHHRIYASLSGSSASQLGDAPIMRIQQRLQLSATSKDDILQREIKADENGFVMAALAGFNTAELFAADGKPGMLDTWVTQTRSLIDDEHHTPGERVAFLEHRLRSIEQQTAMFQFGTRLAHFGRFDDALLLLEDFRRTFPSRQVLANLGYVHIQLARREMTPGMAYRFWFPTLLETSSGFPTVSRQWQQTLTPEAKRHLHEAVQLLSQASSQSATDLVSRVNLVIAHFYLGEMFKARAVVEEALTIQPFDLQLQGLRALVLLEQEPQVDMWQRARDVLDTLVQVPNAPENLIFNLARLYQERGRHGQARTHWQKLVESGQKLPEYYRRIACAEVADLAGCAHNDIAVTSSTLPPLPAFPAASLSIGEDIATRMARQRLQGWNRVEKSFGPTHVAAFWNDAGDAVLALDDRVEMLVAAAAGPLSESALVADVGKPRLIMPLAGGTVFSYGDSHSALLRNNTLAEWWIAR